MSIRFADRADAARQLAERLAGERFPAPPVVLALPRGGVPIAAEVARRLHAPLDLLLVRKVGAPWQPEYAVAAVVDVGGPELVVDTQTAAQVGVDAAWIEHEAARQWPEILRRRHVYLQDRAPQPLGGATAIVVDDGIATGTTVRAALKAVRRRGAACVVLAVPVAPREVVAALRAEADRVICLSEPEPFEAVGLHYDDFHQVGDAEVIDALAAAARPGTPGAGR